MHPALPVIAQIARTDVERLSPTVTLNQLGLNTSLGLSVLRSGLNRKFGCSLAALSWQLTIAELLVAIDGNTTPEAPKFKTGNLAKGREVMSGPFGGRRRVVPTQALPFHGIDIEDLAGMPQWPPTEDGQSFYAEHFTAAELARAAEQPNPRATLCGTWCAKEAVKKCAPELKSLDWRKIEIVAASDGHPEVRFTAPDAGTAWEFSLSISHSAVSAAASVLALRREGG